MKGDMLGPSLPALILSPVLPILYVVLTFIWYWYTKKKYEEEKGV